MVEKRRAHVVQCQRFVLVGTLVGLRENVVVVGRQRDHRIDFAGLGAHHHCSCHAGVPVVAGRVAHRILEELGDEFLQARIDRELEAVAGDGVVRLQGGDQAALGILLHPAVADLPAQVAFVAVLQAVFANGFVVGVAELSQGRSLFDVLQADVSEDMRERVPRWVVPGGGDREFDAGHVCRSLFHHDRLVLRQVLLYRDRDEGHAVVFGVLDERLDVQHLCARQLGELQEDLIARCLVGFIVVAVFVIGQKFRREGGGVFGDVLDERFAVAVDDKAARREDVRGDDVVLGGPAGVVRAVDELHVDEANREDAEEQQDRRAQDVEVSVRPVTARTLLRAAAKAFVQHAHPLPPAPLETHPAASPS